MAILYHRVNCSAYVNRAPIDWTRNVHPLLNSFLFRAWLLSLPFSPSLLFWPSAASASRCTAFYPLWTSMFRSGSTPTSARPRNPALCVPSSLSLLQRKQRPSSWVSAFPIPLVGPMDSVDSVDSMDSMDPRDPLDPIQQSARTVLILPADAS